MFCIFGASAWSKSSSHGLQSDIRVLDHMQTSVWRTSCLPQWKSITTRVPTRDATSCSQLERCTRRKRREWSISSTRYLARNCTTSSKSLRSASPTGTLLIWNPSSYSLVNFNSSYTALPSKMPTFLPSTRPFANGRRWWSIISNQPNSATRNRTSLLVRFSPAFCFTIRIHDLKFYCQCLC